jgi:cobalamin biosynthesis Mg chelatase CobN
MDGAAEENHATAAAATQAKDESHAPARSSSALVDEATRVAVTLNEKLPPPSGQSPAPAANHNAAPGRVREPPAREEEAISGAQAKQTSGRERGGAESPVEPSAGRMPAQEEAGTRSRIGRRAATVGASVGENLRPRVEKLREASTVVFDEATDDPGLRFVIIAAVLFLIFLFILLFSYILG